MSRQAALMLAVAGLGAVAVVMFSPWSPLARRAAPDGWEGLAWSPSKPFQHVTAGGLYHPPLCGEGRTGLIDHGWAWIANPPSEYTGPGYA